MQIILPKIGCGLRLEIQHTIMENLYAFDIVELMVDHYFAANYKTRQYFKSLAQEHTVILHGVGLSIGSATKPSKKYLREVAKAINDLHPIAYGEHLAFTKALQIETAHLLSLPRTLSAFKILVNNIKIAKKHIPIPFMLENIAYYFDYPQDILNEVDFINEICFEADISILLDLENLRINSHNHSYNPYHFIDKLDTNRVFCVHLAGGIKAYNLHLDTHDQVLSDEVYNLLAYLLTKTTPKCII